MIFLYNKKSITNISVGMFLNNISTDNFNNKK